jgi:hypothetical protein
VEEEEEEEEARGEVTEPWAAQEIGMGDGLLVGYEGRRRRIK